MRRRLPEPADPDEARVIEDIRSFGWHAKHVRDEFHPDHPPAQGLEPAVEEASRHGFSYTVGLWPTERHAELILTGNWGTWQKMHQILSAAVCRVREDGASFEPGDEDDQVLERMPVRFGDVAPLYRLELLTWAHWAARRKRFPALQLILPDRDSRWPSEPGYQGPPQPLLEEAHG